MSFNEHLNTFMLGQRLRAGLMGVGGIDPPTLAAQQTWYKGATNEETITSIKMVNRYTPTGNETESWAADENGTGSIMCYVNGTDLTIAGNGSGKIMANEESTFCFQNFFACTSILGFDVFDITVTTDAGYMFDNCKSLTSIDVSNFDTSNVINMEGMFYGCKSLTSIDVSNFDTSNVTNMERMFYDCESLTSIDVSNFDTSNVTSMFNMFRTCESLTSIDVSNFDTSNVTSMNGMFGNCESLTSIDVSNFDTSNVTNMGAMFSGLECITTLDLRNFNTSNVTYMGAMFSTCTNLRQVLVSELWDDTNANKSNMFYACNISSVTYV